MTATIIVAVVSMLAVTGIGGLLTEVGPWYRALRKPRLQPPDWLFGPAWTLILGLAAWSGVLAWTHAQTQAGHLEVAIPVRHERVLPHPLEPAVLQAPPARLVPRRSALHLWASVLALVIGVYPFSHLGSLLVVPYLLWVSFASWLNWAIVRLNAPFRSKQELLS